MPADEQPPDPETPSNSREERIERLAEEFLLALDRGPGESFRLREQFIAAYPELMPELGKRLQQAILIRRARQAAGQNPIPEAASADRIEGDTQDLPSSLPDYLADPSDEQWSSPSLVGDSIPGYQIVREIQRGGQGVVYQAIQKSTRKKVAIKVMREGPFAGAKDKIRFEREVQILAALNHPNIVAIHDSGMASGNFYFVMDYIAGQPLDVWMSSGQRTIEETLKLFTRICEAVNAAHLRGVIHRDLKPGNIRIDGNGQPHVLDFGLAKMATSGLAEESQPAVMTVTGQFLGSLPWASPEQAEGMPGKIDIRTDVYSLGVILYQMLTGKFPYEVVGNMRDVLDRIMKTEPARPSTIRRKINDEVETIVLKCLSKERDRRYQSAGELARDIDRYLDGEPIEAKRDSAMYVFKKTLGRYKLAVAVASCFALVVACSLAGLTVLWQTATRERNMARTAQLAEAQQRKTAEFATTQAAADRDNARIERDRAKTALASFYEERGLQEFHAGTLSEALVYLSEAYQLNASRYSVRFLIAAALRQMKATSHLAYQGRIEWADFHERGDRLLTRNSDGNGVLWDVSSGAMVARFEKVTSPAIWGHGAPDPHTPPAEWGPDRERFLLWRGDDHGQCAQRVDLRLVRNGELLTTLPARAAWFNPEGKRILLLDDHYRFRVLDAETGQEITVLQDQGGDNELIWAGSTGVSGHGSMRCAVFPDGNQSPVPDTPLFKLGRFSQDGKRVITVGSKSGAANVWDVDSGRLVSSLTSSQGWAISASLGASADRVLLLTESLPRPEDKSGHVAPTTRGSASRPTTQLLPKARARFAELWDADKPDLIAILPTPDGRLASAEFSPNGQLLLTVTLEEPTAILNENRVGPEPVSARRPAQRDNRRLNVESLVIQIWDSNTGEKRIELRAARPRMLQMPFPATGVNFSPDCSVLAIEGPAETSLYESTTGQLLLKGTGIARFCSDTSTVLLGNNTGGNDLWDISSRKKLVSFRVDQDAGTLLGSDRHGTRILTGIGDRLRLWDRTDREYWTESGSCGIDVAASPLWRDPALEHALMVDRHGTAWIMRLAGHPAMVTELRHEQHEINFAEFSHDGTRILTTGKQQFAKAIDDRSGRRQTIEWTGNAAALWDARTGQRLATYEPTGSGSRNGSYELASLAPDGKRLIAVDGLGNTTILDTETGRAVTSCGRSDFWRVCGEELIIFTEWPNTPQPGQSASAVPTTKTYELHSGSLKRSVTMRTYGAIGDSTRFVEAHWMRMLLSDERRRQEHLRRQLSPEGQWLIGHLNPGNREDIGVWSTATGELVFTCKERFRGTLAAGFTAAGNRMFVQGAESFRLFDRSSGNLLRSINGTFATSNADGSIVACTLGSATQLLDTTTGTLLASLDSDDHGKAMAFGPDGKLIVTWGNGPPMLWDTASGRRLMTLDSAGESTWATFSPAGDRLLTVADGAAKVWDISPENRPAQDIADWVKAHIQLELKALTENAEESASQPMEAQPPAS